MMKTQTVPLSHTKALALTLAGAAAAALLAPTANASIVSATGLYTPIDFETQLLNIGGMTGVAIRNEIAVTTSKTTGELLIQYSVVGDSLTAGTVAAGALVGPGVSGFNGATLIDRTDSLFCEGNCIGDTPASGSGSGLYGASFDNGSGAQYGWIDMLVFDLGKDTAPPLCDTARLGL